LREAAQIKRTGSARDVIPRLRLFWLGALLALLIFPGVLGSQSAGRLSIVRSLAVPSSVAPSSVDRADDLLNRVWDGIGQAQKNYKSICGTITETRTSNLMVKPLVLHGKFCAEGTTRFALDYFEPSSMKIRFNENYVNVSTGDHTEVIDIGKSARRAQSYFGQDKSLGNLKKQFTVTVQEDSRDYEMKLVPRTDTFRRSLNYLIVKLDKGNFWPRSLEVDGKSGVNSVFVIDVTSMNPEIPVDMFEVEKPK
jgi:outer membrane lipoprotein-sorting protein